MIGSAMIKSGSPTKRLLARIEEFFIRHPTVDTSHSLVAYSGGVDSSCLLDALCTMGRKPVRAIYVNHNLRGSEELIEEEATVRAFCTKRGVPLTIATIKPGDVVALAKRKKLGIEAASREFRYRIFSREATKWNAGFIITAHHEDDLLETLLFRLFRNSGVEGLKGIAEIRSLKPGLDLVRPLLAVPRSLIEDYAAEQSMAFSQDSTNAGNDFARNRLRHHLVPVLDLEFPGWRQGLLGTRSTLAADAEALGASLDRLIEGSGKESPWVPASVFLEAPHALRVRILARLYVASESKAVFSRASLSSVAESLGGGAKVVRCYDRCFRLIDGRLEFSPSLDFRPEHGYFFLIPSPGVYSTGGIEVQASWLNPQEGTNVFESQVERKGCLVEGSFEFPLIVRTRMPGDRLGNEKGSTMVDDLLKSWRIQSGLRDVLPLVEDRRGIVAVLSGALEHPSTEKEKHRYYPGSLSGRRFCIQVKGA